MDSHCEEMNKTGSLSKDFDFLWKLVSSNVSYTQSGVNGLQHAKPPVWSIEEQIQVALTNLMAVDMCFLSWAALLRTVCCLRLQWNSTIRSGLTYYGSVSYCFSKGLPSKFLNHYFQVRGIHLAPNVAASLPHLTNFNCIKWDTSLTRAHNNYFYCTDLNGR